MLQQEIPIIGQSYATVHSHDSLSIINGICKCLITRDGGISRM